MAAGSRLERMNTAVEMLTTEGGLSPSDMLILMAQYLADAPPEAMRAHIESLRSRAEDIRAGLMGELVDATASCDCEDCTALRARASQAAFQQAGQAVAVRASLRRFRGPVGEA